jgi:hypothetical protein
LRPGEAIGRAPFSRRELSDLVVLHADLLEAVNQRGADAISLVQVSGSAEFCSIALKR